MPLIDPDRALWERDLIAGLADCANRHKLTVKAWNDAIEKGSK